MNNLKLRLNIRMLKCLNIKMAEKGVSIYLALMIMFILLAIGLGVSLIIVSQMKMMKGIGDSVVAFYAADTGIEHSLYNYRRQGGDGNVSGSVGGADYQVTSPTAGTYKSKGSFAKAKRAIEINVPIGPCNFSLTTQCDTTQPCPGVFSCIGGGGYDFEKVDVIATVISGTCTSVNFSTDGVDIGGGCYEYTADGTEFKFKACFEDSVGNPSWSCDLSAGSCSRILDLDIILSPAPPADASTTITIYGEADSTQTQTQLDVDMLRLVYCPT